MDDRIVFASDELYLWQAEKPGLSIRGAFVGLAVLTSERLLFLSLGAHEARDRAVASILFGVLGSLLRGKSTKDLDLSALSNPGSLDVALHALGDPKAGRRWDCATYVSFRHPGGVASMMPRTSFLWSGASSWAAQLAAAKAAAASQR